MDFVSFEIAKKLKEKGFREKVNAYYGKYENIFDVHPALDMNDADYRASAPTISQVLKWLREEKKISLEICIHCSLKWVYTIFAFDDGLFMDYTPYLDDIDVINDTIYELYDSYEEAALVGIEYVLDNLI